MMEAHGVGGLKSELDLFSNVAVQLAIDGSSFAEIHPLSSITESGPLEFYITNNALCYLDLSHSIIHLQVKIVKKNGQDLEAADDVAPVNFFLNTLFSECSVFLNDKQIASQINYSYRSIIESILFSSKSSQESLLTAGLFFKDTASHQNVVTVAGANEGYKSRHGLCKTSDGSHRTLTH